MTSSDFVHHAALLAGIDADLQRVMDERAGADPEHRPAAGHVVELDHAVGQHERVVVGQRDDAGAEADVAGALGRGGDEHLGAGDQFEAARMVLADPRLVIVEPVEMLEQFEVALDRQGRVFVVIVERRQKDAAAQIEIVHAEPSGGNACWRRSSAIGPVPASEFPSSDVCCYDRSDHRGTGD